VVKTLLKGAINEQLQQVDTIDDWNSYARVKLETDQKFQELMEFRNKNVMYFLNQTLNQISGGSAEFHATDYDHVKHYINLLELIVDPKNKQDKRLLMKELGLTDAEKINVHDLKAFAKVLRGVSVSFMLFHF